ncbi:MAG: hypothetical protein V4805_14835 [Pseudomonadota bacterium]
MMTMMAGNRTAAGQRCGIGYETNVAVQREPARSTTPRDADNGFQ